MCAPMGAAQVQADLERRVHDVKGVEHEERIGSVVLRTHNPTQLRLLERADAHSRARVLRS